MPDHDYFSTDHELARGRFLAACDAAGFPVSSFRHPGSASLVAKLGLPEALSGSLFVDIVRAGSPDATRMLVLCPGDSESEGLFASGVQVAWLSEGMHRHIPRTTAVIMIHAVTPDGVTWARIAAESAKAVHKSKWSDAMLAAAEERFTAYAEAQGLDLSFAQTGANGLPRQHWPVDLLQDISKQFANSAKDVVFLSLQLGLGPYGQAEIIPCQEAESAGGKRLQAWFDGNDAFITSEDGAPPGALMAGLMGQLADSRVTSAALECGVYSTRSVLASIGGRGKGGDAASMSTERIFYPRDSTWQSAVLQHSRRTIRQILRGLGAD